MFAFSGCDDEDAAPESEAILTQETEIIVPGIASTRTITIYADGTWQADVTDDWLSIEPKRGNGTCDVTLSVTQNTGENEREAEIIIIGSSKLGDTNIDVTQRVDRFASTEETSVTDALDLAAGDMAKLSECQIMAVTTDGFIVSDGTSNIFIKNTDNSLIVGKDSSLVEGDMITLTGDVVAFNSITAIELYDAYYSSNSEVTYPEPTDITNVSSYDPGKSEYVTATVSYGQDGALTVDDTDFGQIYQPTTEDNEMVFHKVQMYGYYLGTDSTGVRYFLSTELTDIEMEAIPLITFEIGTDDFYNTYSSTFGTTHSFSAKTGSGYIEYIPYDLDNTDPDGKFKMDIDQSTAHYDDPRCTGPWPEDYWLFYSEGAVEANTEFNIKFGARTSATGHKYWILEYLDGSVWKTAGTTQTSTDMPSGQNVEYTAAMNSDGKTNVIIDENFTITKNMDALQVRFRCVANWQANGKGALTKRNGGSARLSIRSNTSSTNPVTAPQPAIYIITMGDGVETTDPSEEVATIQLSSSLLTFEGTPEGPQTITVTSDHDFTIASDVSWLTLDVTEGVADSATAITVTCAPSELTTLRQGKLTITSGASTAEINVVQSAAGGDLDPLISLATGNYLTVDKNGGQFTATVMTNVDYSVEILDSWISNASTTTTRSMVENSDYTFNVEANTTGLERVGRIRFYNEQYNIETILNVTQLATTIMFDDNFDWVEEFVEYDKANGRTQGDSMKDKKTYNIGNSYAIPGFLDAFTAKGYEALFPSSKAIYVCEGNYLKFSKTSYVNGIRLPAVSVDSGTTLTVSFDWGYNTTDDVHLIVSVEGSGTINGATQTEELTNESFTWKTESFNVDGADSTTRITIKPVDFTGSKASTKILKRWFLDNVRIEAQ